MVLTSMVYPIWWKDDSKQATSFDSHCKKMGVLSLQRQEIQHSCRDQEISFPERKYLRNNARWTQFMAVPKNDCFLKQKNSIPPMPTVVLAQPPCPHHFSYVKGVKWFGGRYFNRNFKGSEIRRVEKDFILV